MPCAVKGREAIGPHRQSASAAPIAQGRRANFTAAPSKMEVVTLDRIELTSTFQRALKRTEPPSAVSSAQTAVDRISGASADIL